MEPCAGKSLDSFSGVMVGVPYSRPHYGGFLESLVFAETPEHVEFMQLYGWSLDLARNFLTRSFLAGSSGFLLLADNDAEFHPGAIMRLMGHNLPVVCGCMWTKGVPPKPTMGKYLGKAKNGKHFYRFSHVAQAILEKARRELGEEMPESNAFLLGEAELMEIDGCGMHFTLIRRDVIEAMGPRGPWWRFEGDETGGEDFYFCRKARALGFKIYADLSVQTGHLTGEEKEASFGLREFMRVAKFMPLENLVDEQTENWEV